MMKSIFTRSKNGVHFKTIAKKNFTVKNGFRGTVGDTPLIELKSLSEETGCRILAKAEFLNPGGSVKDRAALYIVKNAEASGLLKPGGTVVEGTAGNTGIGLTHVANASGYKSVIFMPDTQSREKIDALRLLGADVRLVPAVPYSNPTMYQHQARDYALTLDNAIWGNQFDNTVNALAHYETTGPEIWEATDGKIDAWTCATGTGGTLAGTAKYLKSKNPNIQVFLADPPGSVLYNYVKKGVLEREGEGSVTEGIGNGRITENTAIALKYVDDALHIPDSESINMIFRLIYKEGISVGTSGGLNVVAAVKAAKLLGPGHTIVTVLCDGASRYQSRLFSKKWLEQKGLYDSVPDYAKKALLD